MDMGILRWEEAEVVEKGQRANPGREGHVYW